MHHFWRTNSLRYINELTLNCLQQPALLCPGKSLTASNDTPAARRRRPNVCLSAQWLVNTVEGTERNDKRLRH